MAAKVALTSLLVFLGSLLITGVFFVVSQYFQTQLEQTETEIASLESELSTYSDVYTRLARMGQQLDSIEQILGNQRFARQKLEIFIDLVDSGLLQVTNVGFGGAMNPLEFEFSGRVTSAADFNRFNQYMKNKAEREEFQTVTLASLNRSGDRVYTFRYLIRFKSN